MTTRFAVAPMAPEAARGRREVIAFALAVWLPSLVGLFTGGVTSARTWTVGALLPGLLLVGLIRGWHWAHTWTTVTLGLGALGGLVGVFVADTIPHRVAAAVVAIMWGVAARRLDQSEAVDAYVEHRAGSP